MTPLQQLDHAHVWHPFTHMRLWLAEPPLVVVGADEFELIAEDGRRYLDGTAALWCNVHGYRVPEVDATIRAQLDRVAHSTLLGLANEPSVKLAAKLAELAPPGLTRVFYADAGACATEAAFKIAAQFWWNAGRPEKRAFVGFADGYHGDTVGAMSVGRSEAFQRPYQPMLFDVRVMPSPVAPGCLEQLEATLREHARTIAAVAIEPTVQAAAGIVVQPPGFLRRVRALCDAHDVLLIADEIATGFGRTGRMFAVEHEGVVPDLMCVGKGLTAGYLPLAAVLVKERVFAAFLGEPWSGRTFFHGHTFTGNPLACAAALASIDLIERRGLLAHVHAVSAKLAARLAQLDSQHVAEVRQCGLFAGVALCRSDGRPFDPRRRVGALVCSRARARGVILRPLGDTVVLAPPLAMPWELVAKLVDALAVELDELSDEDDVPRAPDEIAAGDY